LENYRIACSDLTNTKSKEVVFMSASRRNMPIVCSSICVLVLAACVAYAQMKRRSPGTEPYTPTKLEWLAVILNATRDNNLAGDNFLIWYSTSGDDTIEIFVQYAPDVRREWMNQMVEKYRGEVETVARNYGWNWVKVREKYRKLPI